MILYPREPTLHEMLSDPLIEIVMRADGVDPDKLRVALREVGRGRSLRPASASRCAAAWRRRDLAAAPLSQDPRDGRAQLRHAGAFAR